MIRVPITSGRPESATLVLILVLAAEICISSANLSGENMRLVRHGVMVDQSFCESAVKETVWQQARTGYFDLYIEQGVDLDTVERNLRKRLFLVSHSPGHTAGRMHDIGRRLDAIFDRAMNILDMRPKAALRKVMIFKDSGDLKYVYNKLTGASGNIRAFYTQDCGTIYTSEENITDSVMVHEIAHVIVDSYYKGVPPPKIGEMLASYVDMHISD